MWCVHHILQLNVSSATIIRTILLVACVKNRQRKKLQWNIWRRQARSLPCYHSRCDSTLEGFTSCKPVFLLRKEVFRFDTQCGCVIASGRFEGTCCLISQVMSPWIDLKIWIRKRYIFLFSKRREEMAHTVLQHLNSKAVENSKHCFRDLITYIFLTVIRLFYLLQ